MHNNENDIDEIIEVIPNRLYWISSRNPPKSTQESFYFNIDDELMYEPYNHDFGPLNLSCTHRYAFDLNNLINKEEYKNSKIFHYCSNEYDKKANSVYLICAFLIICLKKNPNEAFHIFENIKLVPFRDVSDGESTFNCTLLHCLFGLYYAIKFKWYDPDKFDPDEYDFYKDISNGDLNWIIPQKLLAFSGPIEQTVDLHTCKFNSKFYSKILKKLDIYTVIRLNFPEYDRKNFLSENVNHYDLYFGDGSAPSDKILKDFFSICDRTRGGIGVHCTAGLGRTGTLISAYAIKNYKIPSEPMIAWTRICRPGSVVGLQQAYLKINESKFLNMNSCLGIKVEDLEYISTFYVLLLENE